LGDFKANRAILRHIVPQPGYRLALYRATPQSRFVVAHRSVLVRPSGVKAGSCKFNFPRSSRRRPGPRAAGSESVGGGPGRSLSSGRLL